MKRSFPMVLFLLVLVIYACSPVTPADQETEVAPQPTTVQGSYPLTTRTGNDEIDHILAAVESGEIQLLRSLIKFTTTECVQPQGLGGPPICREGEAEGTSVEVLPFLGPEGSFFRKDEIGNWPGIEASGLYVIYQVSPTAYSDENYPAGEYAIIFTVQKDASAVALQMSDGKIVRVDYIFDTSPEVLNAVVQRDAGKLILEPAY
jgi:hypothetical protein